MRHPQESSTYYPSPPRQGRQGRTRNEGRENSAKRPAALLIRRLRPGGAPPRTLPRFGAPRRLHFRRGSYRNELRIDHAESSGLRAVSRQAQVTGPGHTSGLPLPLVVVALLLLGPAPARAECGRHVSTAAERGSAGAPCEPGQPCPVPPAPQGPCRGPTCSRAPDSVPFVPPPTPTSPPSQDLALLAERFCPGEPGAVVPLPSGKVRAIHRAVPPDPPPRVDAL